MLEGISKFFNEAGFNMLLTIFEGKKYWISIKSKKNPLFIFQILYLNMNLKVSANFNLTNKSLGEFCQMWRPELFF